MRNVCRKLDSYAALSEVVMKGNNALSASLNWAIPTRSAYHAPKLFEILKGDKTGKKSPQRSRRMKLQKPVVGREWMNTATAADYLGVSTKTLYEWSRQGIIRSGKAGSYRLVFKKKDLDWFVESRNRRKHD